MKLCCLSICKWLRNYVVWVYVNGSKTILVEHIRMAMKLCCLGICKWLRNCVVSVYVNDSEILFGHTCI